MEAVQVGINYEGYVVGLEARKRVMPNGVEYWMGRDLMELLTYADWRNFTTVIEKAKIACEKSKFLVGHHFGATNEMISIGKGAQREREDWFLTRYACYLVAMNADSSKAEVSHAMTYFAGQTRRQEIQEQSAEEQKRLGLRLRISDNNSELTKAATRAGVQNFAFFHDAGYRGLYGGMGLSEVKAHKGLTNDQDLLDHAGRLELAANDLRITLAEERIRRGRIQGQQSAIATHKVVGEEVRTVVTRENGIKPENLPAEKSIRSLVAKHKRAIKKRANQIEGSSRD